MLETKAFYSLSHDQLLIQLEAQPTKLLTLRTNSSSAIKLGQHDLSLLFN